MSPLSLGRDCVVELRRSSFPPRESPRSPMIRYGHSAAEAGFPMRASPSARRRIRGLRRVGKTPERLGDDRSFLRWAPCVDGVDSPEPPFRCDRISLPRVRDRGGRAILTVRGVHRASAALRRESASEPVRCHRSCDGERRGLARFGTGFHGLRLGLGMRPSAKRFDAMRVHPSVRSAANVREPLASPFASRWRAVREYPGLERRVAGVAGCGRRVATSAARRSTPYGEGSGR